MIVTNLILKKRRKRMLTRKRKKNINNELNATLPLVSVWFAEAAVLQDTLVTKIIQTLSLTHTQTSIFDDHIEYNCLITLEKCIKSMSV